MVDRVHWDLTIEGWGRVIYTDETSIILGESRGRKRVTRKQDEEWVLERPLKSTLHSCWALLYRPEDKKERAASIIALAAADVLRRPLDQAAYAIQRAELLGQQKNHKRILTRAPTFFFASSARGGIDWYRDNRCILQPLLLPAYQKFKAQCFINAG